MEAGPIKLLNLLGENKTTFNIPVYQRNYEWKHEHIKKLFDDISAIIENGFTKVHFLGTVVFVSREKTGLVMERTIIDGQQRITSTLLLLKAIYDLLNEKSNVESNLKNEIYDSYLVNRYITDDYKYKLRPVEQDKNAYTNLIESKLNPAYSKMFDNYELFIRLIQNSPYDPIQIYDALANIEIVYISLADGSKSENAQLIFESLNSTGLNLTQADLIRNFVLMSLEYEEQARLYRKYWTELEKFLSNARISDFVRDFLTMKTGQIPNQNKVYDDFKLYFINNDLTSESVLKELLQYAHYYYQFINVLADDEQINEMLWNFDQMHSTVAYPYLLSLFHSYNLDEISHQDILSVLELINSYLYRRTICNLPTNALNKVFASMHSNVKGRGPSVGFVESVTDYLMSRTGSALFPRDVHFKKDFTNLDIYGRRNRLALFTLYSLEKIQHREVVDHNNLSVEHIMPQSLTPKWRIDLGRDSDEVHKLYKDTIGNLTLANTNYNREMSNKGFEEKKNFYSNSNVQITRSISEYPVWNKENIIARANHLFSLAKIRWEQPVDKYTDIELGTLHPGVEYPIADDLNVTGRKPEAIWFYSTRYSVSSWKEMLLASCRYLIDKDRSLFYSLLQNHNFQSLLHDKDNEGRRTEQISEGLFLEVNLSADSILNYIKLLAAEYNIENNISISIRY